MKKIFFKSRNAGNTFKSFKKLVEKSAKLINEVNDLKEVLIELRDAADVYAADQSRAIDDRIGLVQPISVQEGQDLLNALHKANKLIKKYEKH